MHLSSILISFVTICFSMGLAYADSPPLPRDPEVPWEGDPDIGALQDERLKEIWETVVKSYRRTNPYASPAGSMSDEPLPKDAETQEYLITTLDKALHAEPIDWNTVYTAILLLLGGIEPDPRIPELARYMYQLPRPMKMSDPHGRAYSQMLHVLELQEDTASAAVLRDAVNKSFWGDYPYHDRPKRSKEEAVYSKRVVALACLSRMPPDICIPLLETLSKQYPYVQEESDKGLMAYSEFVERLKQNPDGHIPREIESALKGAYEKKAEQEAALQPSRE